jgi:hypothetical protein
MVRQERSWLWWLRWLGCAGCGVLAACNVSAGTSSTGGIPLDAGGVCPSFLSVASSDFVSTDISVLSPGGTAVSPSILSSGSAPAGLTAALSGDVVLPLAPTPGEVVLIDRFSAVVTWVTPSIHIAIRQLPVGTGFSANPHDYLELSPTKAYVTRYETNANAGQQVDDGGGDVLVVNPQAPSITGRVPFTADEGFLPRPDRMMRVGSEVWVSLQRFDASFTTEGDARFVGISTTDDTLAWTLDLPGLADCGGVAMSPAGDVVAVACSGAFGDADPLQRSGIVLLDATAHPPVEIRRIAAATQLGTQLGLTLAYASPDLLVGVALGGPTAVPDDVAFTVDLTSDTAAVVLDAGAAFKLGDVRCSPGCTDLCFLADAQAKVLHVWKASGTLLTVQPSVSVDPAIGLPPQSLGAF